jgi:hypothetical protein
MVRPLDRPLTNSPAMKTSSFFLILRFWVPRLDIRLFLHYNAKISFLIFLFCPPPPPNAVDPRGRAQLFDAEVLQLQGHDELQQRDLQGGRGPMSWENKRKTKRSQFGSPAYPFK